ncbi:MAG: hypothetical protein U0836_17115 [Pirellulales bacterium]
MRPSLILAAVCLLLTLAASQGDGKETKWAAWGSSGGAAPGGTKWWVRVQDGATNFLVSTGNLFFGRGAAAPTSPAGNAFAIPQPKRSGGFGRSGAGHWSTGAQPRSRAEGGSSQTIQDFIGSKSP